MTAETELGWLDAVQDIDQTTIDDTGPSYPYIQWVNGKPTLKQLGGVAFTGGWFFPADNAARDELDGWIAGELVHRDGSSTAGFFRRDLTFAIVRYRRAWLVAGPTRSTFFPWNQYAQAAAAGKAAGKLQVLTVGLGLEEYGPIVLTMRGMVGKAFLSRDSVVTTLRKQVISVADTLNAKRGVKNKFPMRAFWVTVGPQRDAKGTPIFTLVGRAGQEGSQSHITVPVCVGLDQKLDSAGLAERFVGMDRLTWFGEIWQEADEWAHAWDEPAVEEPRSNGNGPAMAPVWDDDPGEEEVPF